MMKAVVKGQAKDGRSGASRPRRGVWRWARTKRDQDDRMSMKWYRRVGASRRTHEEILQVFLAFVIQDRDDGFQFRELIANAARRNHVRPRTRPAEQAAGAREFAHLPDRVGAGDAGGVTDEFAMMRENAGYEAVRDAFDLMQRHFAAQDGARFGGFHREQAHVRVGLAESLADADQRAASSNPVHEGVGRAAFRQLRQDFGAEDFAVLVDVPFVLELAGKEEAGLLAEFTRAFQRIVDVEGAAEKDLGAVGARDRNAFARQAFRHHHDHAVAFHRGDHRKRVAGVAAGGFDNGVAGLDRAGFFGT